MIIIDQIICLVFQLQDLVHSLLKEKIQSCECLPVIGRGRLWLMQQDAKVLRCHIRYYVVGSATARVMKVLVYGYYIGLGVMPRVRGNRGVMGSMANLLGCVTSNGILNVNVAD